MIKYFLEKHDTVDLRLEKKTSGASGYDLMASLHSPRTLHPNERWSVPTGLFLEMPMGVEGQIRTRSGLSRDHGVIVLNAPGTVDSDYRGEICVTLINLGANHHTVIPGDRIAQIVFCPVYVGQLTLDLHMFGLVRVATKGELNHTDRGTSGHGSTGR